MSADTAPVLPQAWQGDHTALVHVLWAARHKGMTLAGADELASFIRRSEYHRAVQELSAAGMPPVRFAEGFTPDDAPGTEHPLLRTIADVLDLGLDPAIRYTPGEYLAEANRVGGRSTWAMRYAAEASAFARERARLDALTRRLAAVHAAYSAQVETTWGLGWTVPTSWGLPDDMHVDPAQTEEVARAMLAQTRHWSDPSGMSDPRVVNRVSVTARWERA
ncbi:hypothetical protein CHO01_36940 [Cellulomonas hominis]|uniref:Uncharacterized protein n=1 Tax=Cellulomonas hominis TaxID=156981 RepID=A0A511FL41_9CELL|nr:hypothetical protein [Cellulomonas hominis]MBB5474722.1 hypothetical protein [Cellulomonas hominis]NKY05984.1 hypothetical protein [Cellulomonas hominis]GEL48578.1 hypothetical protein CHO01_36940 [Cellulomonas hominis]